MVMEIEKVVYEKEVILKDKGDKKRPESLIDSSFSLVPTEWKLRTSCLNGMLVLIIQWSILDYEGGFKL